MASDITGGRKRELKERNGSFKINNIWSGRQGDSYPETDTFLWKILSVYKYIRFN